MNKRDLAVRRLSLCCLVVSLVVLGCSQEKTVNMGSEDGRLVAGVLDDLNEFKSTEGKLALLLVRPGVLPSSDKVGLLEFYIVGKPTIDGDSAKATVSISKLGGLDPKEQQWSFKKVDGNWKIENAPL
ncbi:MAG: hypothetical protein RL069_298 [Planctomycetota bacterium]